MTLRIVGAGLGRTGTLSLKIALERLLGAPCYHMAEVFARPEHVPLWHAAARGEMPDWQRLFSGHAAAVDWPAAAFWPEISEAFPEAIVLLSVRDPESWWRSASSTIFPSSRSVSGPWREMIDAVFEQRFTGRLEDRSACLEAFERWYADARARIPKPRLLEWRASDGWEPLCRALRVPIPDEPFPRTNTTEEFHAMLAARTNGP
ncbi:hypothetical protein MYXO_01734 [Myxococcaceae bacterium]|jgi:hypothetical protein|nr:hypothetical protein MYXO_01734 [Myxococcaceae bacterium]